MVKEGVLVKGFNEEITTTSTDDTIVNSLLKDTILVRELLDRYKRTRKEIACFADRTEEAVRLALLRKATANYKTAMLPTEYENSIKYMLNVGITDYVDKEGNRFLLCETLNVEDLAVLVRNGSNGDYKFIYLDDVFKEIYAERYQGFTIADYKVRQSLLEKFDVKDKPVKVNVTKIKKVVHLNNIKAYFRQKGEKVVGNVSTDKFREYLDYILKGSNLSIYEHCPENTANRLITTKCKLDESGVITRISAVNRTALSTQAYKNNMTLREYLDAIGYKVIDNRVNSDRVMLELEAIKEILLKYYTVEDNLVYIDEEDILYKYIKRITSPVGLSIDEVFSELGLTILYKEELPKKYKPTTLESVLPTGFDLRDLINQTLIKLDMGEPVEIVQKKYLRKYTYYLLEKAAAARHLTITEYASLLGFQYAGNKLQKQYSNIEQDIMKELSQLTFDGKRYYVFGSDQLARLSRIVCTYFPTQSTFEVLKERNIELVCRRPDVTTRYDVLKHLIAKYSKPLSEKGKETLTKSSLLFTSYWGKSLRLSYVKLAKEVFKDDIERYLPNEAYEEYISPKLLLNAFMYYVEKDGLKEGNQILVPIDSRAYHLLRRYSLKYELMFEEISNEIGLEINTYFPENIEE